MEIYPTILKPAEHAEVPTILQEDIASGLERVAKANARFALLVGKPAVVSSYPVSD